MLLGFLPEPPSLGDGHRPVNERKSAPTTKAPSRESTKHRDIEVMNEDLNAKDHAEAVALFRAQVLGPLLCVDLGRRELAAAFRELSVRRYLPPGSTQTRTYAPSTLQRWYYRYRAQGIEGLKPQTRKTGHAQVLAKEQRDLIIAIRREHPNASVPLILRTLEDEGQVDPGQVHEAAVRRLLAAHGLNRKTLARAGKRERRRWQADRPGRLWHADVCHGLALVVNGRKKPLRIHAILDDASRYIVAIAARYTEREVEMLDLLVQAVREHGKPGGLYLDNGATYRGKALSTACGRLGVGLAHAPPYDARARGKMERFWRSLREACLDFIAGLATLHEVQLRLLAFLDKYYHRRPHAGLMGRTPASVWLTREMTPVPEKDLHEALTVRAHRKVRDDGTISVGGIDWEAADGWLAGRKVVVARTLLDHQAPPWVEHEDRRLPLRVVDPKANARRRRKSHKPKTGIDTVDFDPNRIRIDRMLGRKGGGR